MKIIILPNVKVLELQYNKKFKVPRNMVETYGELKYYQFALTPLLNNRTIACDQSRLITLFTGSTKPEIVDINYSSIHLYYEAKEKIKQLIEIKYARQFEY